MKKFTLKLDAICAKLKQGLTGPLAADGTHVNGVSHEGAALTEHCQQHPTVNVKTLDGSEAGVSPCLSSSETDNLSNHSQDESSDLNGFSDPDGFLMGEGLNGRSETPKTLSGASKRKSRLKLAPRRVVDPLDSQQPNENGLTDLAAINEDIGFLRGREWNGGCSDKSQGSNASDSTSMQISLSRQNGDSADNQGNNHVHNISAESALSDRSSLNGEHERDATPLWYEDSSYSEDEFPEMHHEADNEDEESLNEMDGTATSANLSNLKAIQEYAERSLADDQSGQPIEEGLATSDVICELKDEDAEVTSTMRNEIQRHLERGEAESDEDGDDEEGDDKDTDYQIPSDVRLAPLKIPIPVFGKTMLKNPYDPSVVQEYASDTMKELIGMYGFEDAAPDIAKDMPLDSFSFKNILKMEQKSTGKRKRDALQKYISRRANLQIPNPARHHAAHSTTSPNDTGHHPPRSTSDSMDSPNQGNPSGSDVVPQLASQAGVGGKIASLPLSIEPQHKARHPPVVKTTKTVKDLINEQKVKEEGAELEEDDENRPKRFSKYDFFIQSLEAGQAIDYSAHRISKYDSYIRKLKAGEAIHKIIGRRQSASQKIRDIISTQIHRKYEHGEALPGSEDSASEVSPKSYNLATNNHVTTSKYASKYDYFLNKLHKGEDINPFEINLQDVASTSGSSSSTSPNGIPSHASVSTNGSLLDYSDRSAFFGDQGDLVIAEDHHQDMPYGEGTSSGNISNGTAKMVKDEITSDEMNVFSKYITRYSGAAHCGHLHCVYQFKEHYHCIDEGCNFARFTRKEDVVRHYNWHKRRDNSLQHGFMRFSPSDNCGPYYPDCTINLKHTHYHCLQTGCNKVYTSTSDVLTHENFHKKNLSLISEGFQRFRATEDCGVPNCGFYGHKTTHFHCRRPGCEFVFKNKCDIEKHKTYHMKDDIYRKDGFKKYSKHEKCKYNWCKFSNNTNHFHCIRKNCGFVFTAANQMQSHKRKHDRRQRILEYEAARHQRGVSLRLIRPKPIPGLSSMRRGRDAPETVLIQADGSVLPHRLKAMDYIPPLVGATSQSALTPITSSTTTAADSAELPSAFANMNSTGMSTDDLGDSLNLPVASHISPPQIDLTGQQVNAETVTTASSVVAPPAAAAAASMAIATAAIQSTIPSNRSSTGNKFSSTGLKIEGKPEEPWQKYLMRFTANDPCRPRCELLYKDHYHCKVEDCGAVYKSKEGVNKHAR